MTQGKRGRGQGTQTASGTRVWRALLPLRATYALYVPRA